MPSASPGMPKVKGVAQRRKLEQRLPKWRRRHNNIWSSLGSQEVRRYDEAHTDDYAGGDFAIVPKTSSGSVIDNHALEPLAQTSTLR